MDPQIYQHSVYARITCHYPPSLFPEEVKKTLSTRQEARIQEKPANESIAKLSAKASLETRSARVTRCLCPESTLYYLISTRNEENHAWQIHFFHGE